MADLAQFVPILNAGIRYIGARVTPRGGGVTRGDLDAGVGRITSALDGVVGAAQSILLARTNDAQDNLRRLMQASERHIVGRVNDSQDNIRRLLTAAESTILRRIAGIPSAGAAVSGLRGDIAGVQAAMPGIVQTAVQGAAGGIAQAVASRFAADPPAGLARTSDVNAIQAALPGIVGNAVQGAAGGIAAAVTSGVTGGLGGFAGQVSGAVQAISGFIDRVIGPITTAMTQIARILDLVGLDTWAEALSQTSLRLQGLNRAIQDTTSAISTTVGGLTTRIGALQAQAALALNQQTPWIEREATGIEGVLAALISPVPASFVEATSAEMPARRRTDDILLEDSRPDNPIAEDCIPSAAKLVDSDDPWWLRMVAAVINVLGAVYATSGAAQVKAEWCRLAWMRLHPYQPLDPAAVVQAYLALGMSESQMFNALRQHGFDRTRATEMVDSARPIPQAPVIVDAQRRGLVSASDAATMLNRLGYRQRDLDVVVDQLAYETPINDIIRMAVREVFTPAARRAGGLDRDYPPDFTDRAKRLGMDEQTARDYWAAHWDLPSPRQGYEMLHRGIISAQQLDQLLVALDFAPAWRSRLRDISYRVMTRVDVRRMHAMGVLTDSQVERAYRDAGYTPDDARRLKDWTVQLTERSRDRQADREASGLTRASIMRLHRLGVIDRSRALELLEQAGVAADAAALFLDAADVEQQAGEREDHVRSIIIRARDGSLSAQGARDQLAALPLGQRERELATARLDRAIDGRTKTPSRADLDRWAKAGQVAEPEYVQALVDQGWSTSFARRFWASRPEG